MSDKRSTPDSPRWCDVCHAWGDHHTDRCEAAVASPEYTKRVLTHPDVQRAAVEAFEEIARWKRGL